MQKLKILQILIKLHHTQSHIKQKKLNTKKKLRNTPYAHNPKLSNKYVIPFYFRFFFFNYLKLKKKKEKNKIVALLTHLKILYSKTDRDTLKLTANFLRVEPSLSCFIFFF